MRRIAFIIMILGICFLAFLINSDGIYVNSIEDLKVFEINQKVLLSGKVVSERFLYDDVKLLVLESGVGLVCTCGFKNFLDLEVEVEGVISEFEGKRQVEVLKIYF